MGATFSLLSFNNMTSPHSILLFGGLNITGSCGGANTAFPCPAASSLPNCGYAYETQQGYFFAVCAHAT